MIATPIHTFATDPAGFRRYCTGRSPRGAGAYRLLVDIESAFKAAMRLRLLEALVNVALVSTGGPEFALTVPMLARIVLIKFTGWFREAAAAIGIPRSLL